MTSRSLHPSVGNLKFDTEVLTVLIDMYHPGGFKNILLFQGCILEKSSHCEKVSGRYIVRTGDGMRSF